MRSDTPEMRTCAFCPSGVSPQIMQMRVARAYA